MSLEDYRNKISPLKLKEINRINKERDRRSKAISNSLTILKETEFDSICNEFISQVSKYNLNEYEMNKIKNAGSLSKYIRAYREQSYSLTSIYCESAELSYDTPEIGLFRFNGLALNLPLWDDGSGIFSFGFTVYIGVLDDYAWDRASAYIRFAVGGHSGNFDSSPAHEFYYDEERWSISDQKTVKAFFSDMHGSYNVDEVDDFVIEFAGILLKTLDAIKNSKAVYNDVPFFGF